MQLKKKSKTSDISMLIRIQLWQINQFCTQCDDKFTTIIQLFAFFVRAILHLKCQYAYMQFVTLIQVYMFSFDSMFVNNIALLNRTTKLPFDWN